MRMCGVLAVSLFLLVSPGVEAQTRGPQVDSPAESVVPLAGTSASAILRDNRLPCPPSLRTEYSAPVVPSDELRAEYLADLRLAKQGDEDKPRFVKDWYILSLRREAFPYYLPGDAEHPDELVTAGGKTLNEEARQIIGKVGGKLYGVLPTFAFVHAKLDEAQLETLKSDPEVEAISPDAVCTFDDPKPVSAPSAGR